MGATVVPGAAECSNMDGCSCVHVARGVVVSVCVSGWEGGVYCARMVRCARDGLGWHALALCVSGTQHLV